MVGIEGGDGDVQFLPGNSYGCSFESGEALVDGSDISLNTSNYVCCRVILGERGKSCRRPGLYAVVAVVDIRLQVAVNITAKGCYL